MEEKKEVEKVEKVIVQEKGDNFITYIAIAIAVIALVLSMIAYNLKSKVSDLEAQTEVIAYATASLELKALKLELSSLIERVYTAAMLERDYTKAQRLLYQAKDKLSRLKEFISAEEASKLDDLFGKLEAELKKGPSPIPSIVDDIRSTLIISKSPVTGVEKTYKPSPEVKKAADKVVKSKAVSGKAARESGLKKTYEFWKSLGEKLVK